MCLYSYSGLLTDIGIAKHDSKIPVICKMSSLQYLWLFHVTECIPRNCT